MVQLFNSDNIDQLNWQEYEQGLKIEIYWKEAVKKGLHQYIDGAVQSAAILAIENKLLPLVINKGKQTKNQSYVVSLLSQYFDYSREEILKGSKYSKAEKLIAQWFFPIARLGAKFMGFEKVVFVNNFLFSGNLYPDLNLSLLGKALAILKLNYPNYAIVFRSVDEKGNPELFNSLEQNECRPLSARLLYYLDFDETNIKKKRPLQQDIKRWGKQEEFTAQIIEELDPQTLYKIKDLYRQLYLEKHSAFNPSYTEKMLYALYHSKLLEFHGILFQNELSAIQLVWKRQGKVTTPFIGYNQELPREQSPYRHMNVLLTQLAQQNACLLNMSSGAESFKKQRGGKPVFEYNLVHYQHLSTLRQLIWKLMIWASKNLIQKQMTEKFNHS